MFIEFMLIVVLSALATGINSSPATLLQPSTNISLSVSSLTNPPKTRCAVNSRRRNVKAIDCLNLFTFILATTSTHAEPQVFTPSRDAPRSSVYTRKSGACELAVLFSSFTASSVSSIDEILRSALEVVGTCMLDSQPDSTHFGGSAPVPNAELCGGVRGLTQDNLGSNGSSANQTLTQDLACGELIAELADS